MHVVVIGAGVIGVASAWYLAEAGHRVTVIERREAAGLETSFANAAQISPALSAPWAVPGIIRKAIGWAVSANAPLVLGKLPDAAMAGWLWRMRKAATSERYLASKRRMVALAEYSRDRMADLRRELAIDYAGRQLGTLVLFREPAQLAAYRKDLDVLERLKVPFELLERQRLVDVEPNLSLGSGAHSGVLLPGDETGDCHRFTQALAGLCAARGVVFHHGKDAGLVVDGGRVKAVRAGGEEITADAVLVAAGVYSNEVLRGHGVRLPIYPVKGYSLTIAAESDAVGPRSTISEETYKVGITNLGDRIRVGGRAELKGFDLSRPEHRFRPLLDVVRDLFPKVPEQALQGAARWSGLRPMTPDGPPIIGRLRYPNLYLSSGHGTLGWTMACGSGKVLADLVSGRRPEVEVDHPALRQA